MSLIILKYALATLPSLFITGGVIYLNKQAKEVVQLLLISFAAGCFVTIPCYLFQTWFVAKGFDGESSTLELILFSFLGIAALEELVKFFALWLISRKIGFTNPDTPVITSLLVAMGFTFVENLIYAYKYDWITVAVRMFTALPLHIICGTIVGIFLGKTINKSGNEKNYLLAIGLLVAILIHGFYDLFIEQKWNESLSALSLFVLFIGIGVIFFLKKKPSSINV
ncbi:MAG: PrsW family intramembrane metalloprotease [Saprospiraceae bacterium]|nr:PrsW family intramembrane metalloprotease [Saprospiraceae bacterium]